MRDTRRPPERSTAERSAAPGGWASLLLVGVLALALAACSSAPPRPLTTERMPDTAVARPPETATVRPPDAAMVRPPPTTGASPTRKPGGYYLDDGPEANPPAIDFAQVPDAVPELLPLQSGANRPYEALGEVYFPDTSNLPFSERGVATWYGRRFHGHRTASGERYDMYAMTAAHKTLPIPSYARVTHVQSGKSVVVRINDRGPFASGRVIDLSYTAAVKLGLLGRGSAEVIVERAFPQDGSAAATGVATVGAPPSARVSTSASTPEQTGGAPPSARVSTSVSTAEQGGGAPLGTATATATANANANATAGLALQLGAFRDALNAQRLLDRARQALPEHAAALQVVVADGLHRVRLGPLSDPATQSSVADLVNARLGLRPRLLGP